ncbi:TPA: hypothetical protein N0F65_005147 [Lagenidium giganteum]|uniref:4-aminobutyrate aminotransferase n=1 Tax=Lagenidium giganteum TaxID=4803 RepID=A0AAV2YX33_9STRA|nr:TPA: hypothetical protein N0F65_005147 [Lagenidium giganteum]
MVPSGGGDVKTSGYLMGSRRLLEEIRRREKNVPPAVAHMQDLLEHIDTNAAQIASALAASRRRRSQEGLAGVSALLQEQDKLLKELKVAGHSFKCKPRRKRPRPSTTLHSRQDTPPDQTSMGKDNLVRGIGRMSNLVMQRGKGSFVWTTDNRKLLDFTSGIAVTNLGHCHPRVVEAAQKQVATLVHGQVNIGYHEPMLKLVDRLLPLMPTGLDSLFFATTGSEAVENAVKLARHATGKQNIIVFQGGYHGRTLGAMSLTTSKTIYRAGFGPLMPGVTVVPYPYSVHGPVYDNEECGAWCLDQLRLSLKQQTAPSETAAVLIEPILGEGGYVVPTKSFMQGLRQICTENDMLLITDEVQCGFGRTGEYFASNGHFDVTPDILVMAKGIANGFPLSGIASRKELTDRQPPGSMGGTYAGNAVSCAAALATQDVIRDELVLDNTKARGIELVEGLNRLKASGKYPILDVRGIGLMVAIEFDPKAVPAGTASRISQACLDHGMMVLTTSVFETLRLMPPLTLSAEECQLGLDIFEKALDDVFAK